MPADLLRAVSLVGPQSYVRERVAAFAEAGVTTLQITPLDGSRHGRVAAVRKVRDLTA